MKKRLLIGCGGLMALLVVVLAALLFLVIHRTPGQYFDSNGTRVYYTDEGQGEPVILIHGSGVNADLNWRRSGVTRVLARHLRVIAFDLRAHGRTDAPTDPDRYGIQMVEDITRLMDHLRIAKAHFAGYSLGGFVLLKFVSIHPERVQSAALCAAGWKNPEDLSPLPKPNAPPDRQAQVKQVQASVAGGRPKPLYRRVRQWVENQIIDETAKKALKKKYVELGVPQQDLKRIQVPLLCLIGTRDGLYPLAQDLRANLPGVQFIEIPGATHLTSPFYGQFRKSLLQFFLRNQARSSQVTSNPNN